MAHPYKVHHFLQVKVQGLVGQPDPRFGHLGLTQLSLQFCLRHDLRRPENQRESIDLRLAVRHGHRLDVLHEHNHKERARNVRFDHHQEPVPAVEEVHPRFAIVLRHPVLRANP